MRPLFQPSTILVVDDDPDIRSLLRTFLEHEGYVVYASGDQNRATQIFRRSPVDLVILDYSMPQRSGSELARELQTIRPSVCIMIISGAIMPPAELEQVQTRGWTFLAKPFSLPKLLTEVHTILASFDEGSATLIA